MPDSQSSEPGFESCFATVSKIGHFRSLHWRPCWLSCINEYLAIDSGGHVSDLVVARNCCMTRMLPGEAELVSEWTGLPGRAKSVKRFERSNGLDTALYKNYLYLLCVPVLQQSGRNPTLKLRVSINLSNHNPNPNRMRDSSLSVCSSSTTVGEKPNLESPQSVLEKWHKWVDW